MRKTLKHLLIVQRILPHYRVPFFTALAKSEKLQLTLAYGRESKNSTPESVRKPKGLLVVNLNNHYVIKGKRELLVYQSGVLPLVNAHRNSAVIAEFNVRILSNLIVFFRSRRLAIPFIWWGHGYSPGSSLFSRRFRRWLAKKADAVIVYESEMANRFEKEGVPAQKLFVAKNTIDTEAIQPLVAGTSHSERRRILYIGRFIESKKVGLLIQAFARARKELPHNYILTIIGDGPCRSDMENLVTELGIANAVEFAGHIEDEKHLATFFNESLVSVSPGYIGLSAIHSLSYGIPVLVADNEPHSPEIEAIVSCDTGLFFKSDDSDNLALKIVQFWKNPRMWKTMRQLCLNKIETTYSLEAMVRVFENAVAYALSNHPKS